MGVHTSKNVWIAPKMGFKEDFWLQNDKTKEEKKGTTINRLMHQSGSKGSQSMLDDWAILSGHFIGQGWVRDLYLMIFLFLHQNLEN